MIRNPGENEKKEIEISPTEDLMREHGVMHRLLLIYKEVLKYLKEQKFGENEFEHIVNEVANIEKTLSIYNLAQFTPVENDLVFC